MDQAPRVIFIGDPAVGKTCLITRMMEKQFRADTMPTTAMAAFMYTPYEGSDYSIAIWDTAGMEQYRAINRIYYRDAAAAILVFDFTSRDTFTSLNSWQQDFTSNSHEGAVLVVVGNKSDRASDFEVTEDEARSWADAANAIFCTTSAATGDGVTELLDVIVQAVPHPRACNHVVIELKSGSYGNRCC